MGAAGNEVAARARAMIRAGTASSRQAGRAAAQRVGQTGALDPCAAVEGWRGRHHPRQRVLRAVPVVGRQRRRRRHAQPGEHGDGAHHEAAVLMAVKRIRPGRPRACVCGCTAARSRKSACCCHARFWGRRWIRSSRTDWPIACARRSRSGLKFERGKKYFLKKKKKKKKKKTDEHFAGD